MILNVKLFSMIISSKLYKTFFGYYMILSCHLINIYLDKYDKGFIFLIENLEKQVLRIDKKIKLYF